MTPIVAGPSAVSKASDFTLPSKYSLTLNMTTSHFCAHARILCDSACRLRPATSTKQKGQHKPRQKSADVRHVSDATRLRCVGNGTDAAKKLQNEPHPNDYHRGHLKHLLSLQYSDLSLWEQQYVR